MTTPHGRIIELNKYSDPPTVVVEVPGSVRCVRCAQGRGCGAGLLGGDERARRIDATIGEGLDLHTGDRVQVVLDPRNLLQGAFVAYGVPLLTIVAAVTLAYLAGLGELATAVAALVGMLVGAAAARTYLGSRQCIRRFRPVVVGRLAS